MKPLTPEQLDQESKAFRAIVRQMPKFLMSVDATTMVAIITQVQLAACHPLNRTPLATRAQDAVREIIREFPAPAAALMSRSWQAPSTVIAGDLEKTPEPPPPMGLRAALKLAVACGVVALACAARKVRLMRASVWLLQRAFRSLNNFPVQQSFAEIARPNMG